jgi:hypothetical protein
VGELSRKREDIVEANCKGGSLRLVALIIPILIQSMCTSTTAAAEPSEVELTAVVSSWGKIKSLIENGAPIKGTVPFVSDEEAPSYDQKQDIFRLARKADLWRDIWFVVLKRDLMLRKRAIVYFWPDQVEQGIRRGKSVSFLLFQQRRMQEKPVDLIRSMEGYAQVEEGPVEASAPGAWRRPFRISEGMTMDELVEIVHLIRVGPKPFPPKLGIRNPFVQSGDPDVAFIDRSEPIMSISHLGDVIKVETGYRRSGLDGNGQSIECKKVDGVWVITSVGMWVN